MQCTRSYCIRSPNTNSTMDSHQSKPSKASIQSREGIIEWKQHTRPKSVSPDSKVAHLAGLIPRRFNSSTAQKCTRATDSVPSFANAWPWKARNHALFVSLYDLAATTRDKRSLAGTARGVPSGQPAMLLEEPQSNCQLRVATEPHSLFVPLTR